MLSAFLTTPLAHRGLHGIFPDGIRPENSLSAFKAAFRAGYGVELDVRLLADGNVVVFHDVDTYRMCRREGRIGNYRAKNIQQLRLGNTDESPPLLRDVLALVNNSCPLLIEVKDHSPEALLVRRVCELLRDYGGPAAIASFHPGVILWLKYNEPGIIRGQLGARNVYDGYPFITRWMLRCLIFCIVSQPHFLAYCVDDVRSFCVQCWRRAGTPLIAWTVRSEQDATQAKAYVENIIFEGFFPLLSRVI